MFPAANRARELLADTAGCVRDFLHSQIAPGGGFRNRNGEPDLYYTGFGLAALAALGSPLPGHVARPFLDRYGDGDGLDLVHLASLARAHAHLDCPDVPAHTRARFLGRLRAFALPGGGFALRAGARAGTIYASFLAAQIHDDLGAPCPDPTPFLRPLGALRAPDGGWINEPGALTGATAPTAAALSLLRMFRHPAPPDAVDWLARRRHSGSGFTSSPLVSLPDLLSTAVSLEALADTGRMLGSLRSCCLDFVASLWDNRGGFCAHWMDPQPDAEYTFYGLLALGHLASPAVSRADPA